MKSPVVKRSIVVAGHKTSVSLEEAFWNGMKEISGLRNMTLSELVGEIDSNRQQGNLSSAIRLFVLDYFRTRAMPPAAAPDAPARRPDLRSGARIARALSVLIGSEPKLDFVLTRFLPQISLRNLRKLIAMRTGIHFARKRYRRARRVTP